MIIKLTNLDGSSEDFEFEDDEVTANGIKDFFKGRGNGNLFRLGENGRRIGVLKDQLNLQCQYEYVLNNPIEDISSVRNIMAFPSFEEKVIDLSHFGNVFSDLVMKTHWTMYFREEYQIAMKEWKDSERGFILAGSPGIGKTTFGRLLLCLLISEGERVLYWQHNEAFPIIFEGNIAKRVSKATMGHLDETVVIYDNRTGFQYEFGDSLVKKMLIIHSPSGDINNSTKAFNLEERVWYMNTANLEECEKIRVACHWKISQDRLRDNFRITGGLLRYLNSNDNDSLMSRVIEGCQKVASLKFADIVNYNYLPENSESLNHRVIHIRRFNDHGGRKVLEFGSDFIEEEILKIVGEKSDSELLILANKVDINGSLRGNIFENRMHHHLSNGSKFQFKTKPLVVKGDKSAPDSSNLLLILLKNSFPFSKLTDISQVDLDTFYRYYPKDKRICLKSIDAFFLSVINNEVILVLLQMTVSESHPVKRQGLIDIINIVKNYHEDFKTLLVFLTPPVVFDKWKETQKIINAEDKTESKTFLCEQETWCLLEIDSKILWND